MCEMDRVIKGVQWTTFLVHGVTILVDVAVMIPTYITAPQPYSYSTPTSPFSFPFPILAYVHECNNCTMFSRGHFRSLEPNFCCLALLGSKLLTQIISAILSIYSAKQDLSTAEPRHGHALREHPPTSPCPVLSAHAEPISPKDIAGCDIMKLKVCCRYATLGIKEF